MPVENQKSSITRDQMQRVTRIIKELQKGGYPNQVKLAEILGMSKRTVQRDLKCIKEGLGVPVEFCSKNNGFFIDGDLAHLPTYLIEEGEILAMFVAQRALVQYRGTSFEKPLKTAFERLSRHMTDLVQFAPDELDHYVSFRHTGHEVQELTVFSRVARALHEHRELRFAYLKFEGKTAEDRHVQPLHLACINDQWYLFAFDCNRDAVRTFLLSRIRGAVETGEVFERQAGFSLKGLLANAFGVFHGDGEFPIELRFDAFGARLVREKQWHDSQEIEETPDGGLILRMQLGALEEVERWILWFGQHVQVLGPPQLVQRLKEATRQMAELYQDAPRWLSDLKENIDPESPQILFDMLIEPDLSYDHPGQLHFELGRN